MKKIEATFSGVSFAVAGTAGMMLALDLHAPAFAMATAGTVLTMLAYVVVSRTLGRARAPGE